MRRPVARGLSQRHRLDPGALARDTGAMTELFWKVKSLEEMTPQEWEALCDGCGKCCLAKLEDEDSGEIYFTSVGCRLFDAGLCRCTDYENRQVRVADCIRLTPENVRTIPWLPSTCAYRLVAEGRDLPHWHHLISGSRETIHRAGMSMQGRITALETDMAEPEDYFDHLMEEEP